MPGWLGLLALIGGLAVVCVSLFYPREIGKEAEPIVDISGLDLPPVEDILNRMRHPRGGARPAPTPVPSAASTPPSPPAASTATAAAELAQLLNAQQEGAPTA